MKKEFGGRADSQAFVAGLAFATKPWPVQPDMLVAALRTALRRSAVSTARIAGAPPKGCVRTLPAGM